MDLGINTQREGKEEHGCCCSSAGTPLSPQTVNVCTLCFGQEMRSLKMEEDKILLIGALHPHGFGACVAF